MQEPIKPMPAREMHKYVWGFVGVFFLIAGSYPISFWRVSQDQKFAGFHVKSFTDAGKPKLPSDAAVAVQTPATNPAMNASVAVQPGNPAETMATMNNASVAVQPGNPAEQMATMNNASVAVQPGNMAETIASSSNANTFAQPEKITDANQSTAIVNPTIGNNPSQQIVGNDSQVALNPTDRVQLRELNQKVYDQIAKNWQLGRRFEQSLVYRVSATAEGAIASFKPVNQSASDLVQQTPLANLLPSSVSTNTPVADFRVVFTSLGVLEVSPWDGFGK
ncbi:hypothetical protein [Microseira wollei]|uniref:Serine/threonine protein kinase n=1 Tax=Microseira wollei NIES-4236 TaxID=2530354 RepID=A0AAV3XF48_9CYAN|nr:hypothetical protein [Microseira wollei]GET40108.1 hypothetical protein MiSe_49160 [Microseira wollei NIES-4236]